ncbi:MAG: porin [Alishewanella sp.]|nr:porin [Alishewanella sp.]
MKKTVLSLALLGCLSAPVAFADVAINGFASIKGGMTTESDQQLYGYDNNFDLKNESLFALQVKSDLGEKLSVTGQLIGRGSKDFDVGFEWAFITYELSENMRINAGRLRTPFYKYSDFKDVAYAYDWLRVPQGVYGLGFDNIEGVSFYRTAQIGGLDSTLQAVAGSYDGETTVSGFEVDAEIKNILGLTWELSNGNLSGRVAYLRGKVTIDAESASLSPTLTIGGLLNTLNGLGLNTLVSDIDIQDETGSFLGLGLTYDNGDWVLVSEITQVTVDNSFIAEQNNFYVSLGKRFNNLTPYISYEVEDNESRDNIFTPFQAVLPAQLFVPVQGIVRSQERSAKTWNLGARYDFHPSAAFKVQYSSEKNDSTGDRIGLIALGVDLVF